MSHQRSFDQMKRTAKHSIGFTIIVSTIGLVLILVVLIVIANYLNFYRNIEETTDVQTQEISRQIVYNYENYISTIIETSNLIQEDISNRDVKNEESAISEYLADLIRLKKEIIRIDLYDIDGNNLSSSENKELHTNFPYPKQEDWFVWALRDPTIHNFSVPYQEYGTYRITISKAIDFNRSQDQGILKIEINFDNIIELAKKSNLGYGGYISIIDSNYNTVYTSKNTIALSDDKEKEVLKSIVLGSKSANVEGYEMMIHVDTLENTKWRICVYNNIDQLLMIHRNFLRDLIFISILFIMGAIVFLLSISKRITKPLEELEIVMKNVQDNEFFMIEEVHLNAYKEVENLSIGYNHMMKRIKELMDEVVVEQKEQRKSELKALQHQINPHFLYNTLDSITWMIEKNQNDDATRMIVALAKLFRISINKGKNVIPIKDEIEHARNYLLIQSYRYHDTFEYEFVVDKDLLAEDTIKLILQPIIENAIYHGLKNKIDPGKITIRVEQVDQSIKLSVQDNGYGMRQEKIDALYERLYNPNVKGGVGLKNVYQRLFLYYGEKAQLRIESELDEGTTISVIIPINYEVGEES
jgi:two-component system, sensor histidine kinase YesM